MSETTASNNLPSVRSAQPPATLSVFSSMADFEVAQRMARALASSALVPDNYRGEANLPNVLIAMEYAGKCGMSVLAVMQNLHVIQGRPSWSAPFLISSVNATGRFTPLRYERRENGKQKAEIITWEGPQGQRKQVVKTVEIPEDFAFRAWAIDKQTNEKLFGPWVSMKMAHEEGWTSRAGNKYRTMPEQMLMYRSASFFTRLYCPEVSMGMHTTEEAYDYADFEEVTPGATVIEEKPAAKGASKVNQAVKGATAKTGQQPGAQQVIEIPAQPAAQDDPILPETDPATVAAQDPAVEQMYAEPDPNEYEQAM